MARFKYRPPCSEESKRKIAEALRGKKLSVEHRQRIGDGLALGRKRAKALFM